jgi:DNA primase small subunit
MKIGSYPGALPMAGEMEFIMQRFRDYYISSPPPPPERFGRREFGFMFFDKNFVQRHLGFAKEADFQAFLRDRVPSHAYYSSAYYKDPGAEKMEDKTWLGADLIFDLDADHIPGAESLSYTEMLARVKQEMIRLLDDYVLGDLGFDESYLKVTFSGGRGYHAHISDPKVQMLRSHERREIVDYIIGTDLNMDWLVRTRGTVPRAACRAIRPGSFPLLRAGAGKESWAAPSLASLTSWNRRARQERGEDIPH